MKNLSLKMNLLWYSGLSYRSLKFIKSKVLKQGRVGEKEKSAVEEEKLVRERSCGSLGNNSGLENDREGGLQKRSVHRKGWICYA